MTAARSSTLLLRIPLFLTLLAVAVFAALSLNFNAATRFYAWPWFFYWQVLLLAPVTLLSGRLLVGRSQPRCFGGWLDAGLGLLTIAGVMSAVFSPFRPQSLNAAIIPVSAVCMAYLALDWIERDVACRQQRLLLLARLVGTLMSLFVVVSFAMWLTYDVLPAGAAGRPLSEAWSIRNANPLGHSTYTAGFAVIAAPWLAALGLAARRGSRALWLAATLLAVALVPTTSSRGGVLGLLAALACAAAFWLHRPTLARNWRVAILLIFLLMTGFFIGSNPRLRDFLRQGHWGQLATESNRQRYAMARAGWLMGRDRPMTGWGPGTVSLVYPRYRAQLPGGTEDVLQLHSLPVQIWAEFGMIGVLAALLLVIGVTGLARVSTNESGDSSPPHRLFAQAALSSLVGYAAMAFTDYQLDVPLFAAVVALLLTLLRVCRSGVPTIAAPARRPLGFVLLVVLVLILWPMLPNLHARWLFARAADAREAGQAGVFVGLTEKAAVVAPWEPFYRVQLGAFFGEQYLQASDPTMQAWGRERSAAELRRALAVNPDQEYCHFNLGWLLWLPDPSAAERHFRAAARLVPDKGGVYLGLGLSLLARNEKETAIAAFALEWLNDPQTMSSPFWSMPPLAALHNEIMAAVHRQISVWLAHDGLPPAADRQLRYLAALVDWWHGGAIDSHVLTRDGSAEQRRFFEHLPALEQRAYTPSVSGRQQPWEQLYVAWRAGAPPPDVADAGFAIALARRLARESTSFARVLSAPVETETDLVQITRRQRLGYSVLIRNQDGFLLSDLHLFPENRLVMRYASFLFPPKGYLPGDLLLARLNDSSSAPR